MTQEITMEPPKELPSVEQQVIEPSPVATTADTTVACQQKEMIVHYIVFY